MKSPAKLGVRVPHDRSGRAACPHAAAPWPKVRLEEICKTITDGDHLAPPKTDSGIPFVTISDIKNNKFDLSDTRFVPKAYYDGLDEKRKVRKGDVLYSVVGSYGIPVYAESDLEIAFQRHIAILKAGDSIDSRFLFYSMLNPAFYYSADNVAVGTAQKTVTLSALRNLEIPLPPLPIQQRIASVLGAYDDLIENNRRRIALLEKMAGELYRERFVRRAGKGNSVTLGKIMSITRGLSYSSKEIDTEDGVNLINLKNIRSFGGFREEGTKKYSGDYKNAQVVQKGDLVMGVTDMTQDRRTVGAVALLPELEGESVISADLIKIDSELGNCFLFCMFCYGGVSSQVGQFATGATVLHLRPQAVLDFSVTLPAREEVEAFESQISPLFEEQGNLLSQNRSLSRQRDRLLPRLMSGKIDVEALVKEEK